MPTLYLIDGYAAFFRCYHAIRTPMTSPVTKEPTNMTFGFVGLLLKLLRGDGLGAPLAPDDMIAVALDVSGDRGTFRSELYPDYKATRPPPPEDLFPQVERCLTMLREIGVPIIGAEGFEADDVSATLVRQLLDARKDLRIRLVSKDKDLKQLLDDQGRVELFDAHTATAFNACTLKEQTGLSPTQIVDMLALMGDSVDNVPGVTGVGEKTAIALLNEWGSIKNVLAHAKEIKGKRGENIRAAASLLPLSQRLVTLRDDVPVEFDGAAAQVRAFTLDKIIPILKELGFNRYQDDVRAILGLTPAPPDGGARTPTSRSSAPPPPANQTAPTKRSTRKNDDTYTGGLFTDTSVTVATIAPQSGEYTAITTTKALKSLVDRLERAPLFAFDTETTSLAPIDARLCGLSIAVEPGQAWYIPVRSPTPEDHLDEATVLTALRPILEDNAMPKVGHNLKYDALVLRGAGVMLRGFTTPPGGDSMVASYLIDASRSSHSLDALALALLNRTNISIHELIGSGKSQRSFKTVPVDQATTYAGEDADVTLQLFSIMAPQLKAMKLESLFYGVEMPLVEVLAELEFNGVRVDADELSRQEARLVARLAQIRTELDRISIDTIGRTFEPESPKQLGVVLFGKPTDDPPGLGLKPLKKTKTGHSTDAEVLEKLAEDPDIETPIPGLILEYRQLSKLVSTYLVALREAINPKTGRVHASFHQTVAATGRLASSDPNLQNIPIRSDIGREIRKAFVADTGNVLITADYSQVELRLLAHLSKDPALVAAFKADEDIHTAVAAQIHQVAPDQVTREQRSGAKMVNFGIVYGITAFGLARRLNIHERDAAEIITGYKTRFPGITTFLQECVAQAERHGYVATMLGRRRPISDIHSTTPARKALAERLAINSVVQGSAADLIKLAMVDLHTRLADSASHWRGGNPPEISGVRMLLQIHDELVFEARSGIAEKARELIVSRMEGAMDLLVPLKVGSYISSNWYDGK